MKAASLASLQMVVERTATGFAVLAPWLVEPIEGNTFEDCYFAALKVLRSRGEHHER